MIACTSGKADDCLVEAFAAIESGFCVLFEKLSNREIFSLIWEITEVREVFVDLPDASVWVVLAILYISISVKLSSV